MPIYQNPVQVLSRKLNMLNLEITYPYIVGGVNPAATQKMNSDIITLVKALIQSQGYYQDPASTQVVGDFEIKTNERGVLSLSVINYTYHYHAAHGMTIIKSLTFDITTGRSYQLYELFKQGTDYLKRLSALVEAQIKERQVPLLDAFPGVRATQDYYIADKALVVYYQLYEITPYVYGFPQFPISVYSLEDVIDEKGPLGIMLQNN